MFPILLLNLGEISDRKDVAVSRQITFKITITGTTNMMQCTKLSGRLGNTGAVGGGTGGAGSPMAINHNPCNLLKS